jgi:hypothetical protein
VGTRCGTESFDAVRDPRAALVELSPAEPAGAVLDGDVVRIAPRQLRE